jgi:hypothetical protein
MANPVTRKSIDREHEIIAIGRKDDKDLHDALKAYNKKYKTASSIKTKRIPSSTNIFTDSSRSTDCDHTFHKDIKYHIAICQDGNLVATFDTGNSLFHIRCYKINYFNVNSFF